MEPRTQEYPWWPHNWTVELEAASPDIWLGRDRGDRGSDRHRYRLAVIELEAEQRAELMKQLEAGDQPFEREARARAIAHPCPECNVKSGARCVTRKRTFDAPGYPPPRNIAETRKYPHPNSRVAGTAHRAIWGEAWWD